MPPASSFRPRAAGPVYTRLLELIIRGRLGPGARVTESAVAQSLGVSRTPIREAMQRLVRDGLLVPVDGHGGGRTRLAVAPMDVVVMEELYRIAGMLEGLAARGIAKLPSAQRREVARRLDAAERAFEEAAGDPPLDYDRLFRRHGTFHRELVDPGTGRELRAALAAIRPRLDRFEWYYAPLVGPDLAATFREHKAIIQTVRRGTPGAIERAVRANWFHGATRLARALARAQAGTS